MNFDTTTLRLFKRAYNKALKSGKDQFIFNGEIFLVSYAKYLVEYLSSKTKEIPLDLAKKIMNGEI